MTNEERLALAYADLDKAYANLAKAEGILAKAYADLDKAVADLVQGQGPRFGPLLIDKPRAVGNGASNRGKAPKGKRHGMD